MPKETITFVYGKLQMKYTPETHTGSSTIAQLPYPKSTSLVSSGSCIWCPE
jgi:hypothetical protein